MQVENYLKRFVAAERQTKGGANGRGQNAGQQQQKQALATQGWDYKPEQQPQKHQPQNNQQQQKPASGNGSNQQNQAYGNGQNRPAQPASQQNQNQNQQKQQQSPVFGKPGWDYKPDHASPTVHRKRSMPQLSNQSSYASLRSASQDMQPPKAPYQSMHAPAPVPAKTAAPFQSQHAPPPRPKSTTWGKATKPVIPTPPITPPTQAEVERMAGEKLKGTYTSTSTPVRPY
ncbi:hypothetical protein EDC01DRAFT_218657 [Geopyxis carbonaria]|nr:hypothetical protein EDC01DRAFT_218657 [Geopyxis carbonaria]